MLKSDLINRMYRNDSVFRKKKRNAKWMRWVDIMPQKGLSRDKIKDVVDVMLEQMSCAMTADNSHVEIRSFGRFRLHKYNKYREHINPKTQEVIGIKKVSPRLIFKSYFKVGERENRND